MNPTKCVQIINRAAHCHLLYEHARVANNGLCSQRRALWVQPQAVIF